MIVDDYGNEVALGTVQGITQRLDEGDTRMGRIEGDLAAVRADLNANTEATQTVAANTGELVEMFQAMKGALKVLNWIGSLVKPMGYIAAFGTALLGLWTALKGHMR